MLKVISQSLMADTTKIYSSNLMSAVVSSDVLEQAFSYIYKKLKDYRHNGIWHLKQNLQSDKQKLHTVLLQNKNKLYLLDIKYNQHTSKYYAISPSQDDIVLKVILIVLSQYFKTIKLSKDIYHSVDNCGSKGIFCKTNTLQKQNTYVIKSGISQNLDDWLIIFTKTKTQLSSAVKSMYAIIKKQKFTLALDIIFINKTTKEFDFFGYCFEGRQLIELARKRLRFFLTKSLCFVRKMRLASASVYINKRRS